MVRSKFKDEHPFGKYRSLGASAYRHTYPCAPFDYLLVDCGFILNSVAPFIKRKLSFVDLARQEKAGG
jgi:hypothetical protein